MGDVDPLECQQASGTPPAKVSDELMTVKLRFKAPDGDQSRLVTHVVREPSETADEPSSDFAFATAVAELAIILRDSEHKDRASLESVLERARREREHDPDGDRAESARLVALAETLQLAGGGRTSSRR
jgi:Ca-activated chloride channel family protein